MIHFHPDAIRKLVLWVWLFAALLLGPSAEFASAQRSEKALAESRVTSMLANMDGLSARQELSDVAMASRFKALADAYFAVAIMARNSLSYEAYQQLTARNRLEYVQAFREHLAQGFVIGTRQTGAVASKVLATRNAPNGSVIVISRTQFSNRDKDTFWFMCRGQPRMVCDIEVDGIRASARQKAEFSRVLKERGLKGLLTDLSSGMLARRLS